MSDLLIAWAAGLFEGEGTISVGGKRQRRCSLQMSMTDEDVVRRFAAVVGLGSVSGPYDRGHKPVWHWHCTSAREVEAVLALFLPYLGARRLAKAREALDVAASIGARWQDRTHCKHGHPFSGDNLRVRKKTGGGQQRHCRTCERERFARFKAKRKGVGDV